MSSGGIRQSFGQRRVGAEHTFFKFGVNSGYSWGSTARSVILAVMGVCMINQLCRGNIMGRVTETSEVYVPVALSRPTPRNTPPMMDGFAGDDDTPNTR
mmetsp:Transcript_69903/g.81529  ORF Transcript_69903/g.81529 Transcript_69903/m.81529 type:complete len:99 (+) Transcript_69903:100-396(+)